MSDMHKLIVDVDTGIDDSLALLYLLASPEAEILGIASTAGNVPVEQVAANNLNWLALCGAPDIEVALAPASHWSYRCAPPRRLTVRKESAMRSSPIRVASARSEPPPTSGWISSGSTPDNSPGW